MNCRILTYSGIAMLLAALTTSKTFAQCSGGGGGQRGGGTMTGMTSIPQMGLGYQSQLPYQQNSGVGQYANYANTAYQQMQQALVQQQLQRAYLQQMLQQEALNRATVAAERREATRQKRLLAANARKAREAKKQDEEFRRSQSSLASTK